MNRVWIPLLAALLCFGTGLPLFFHAVWQGQRGRLLLFKALSTCCALAVAVCGLVLNAPEWRWLTVVSIALCAAADVVLELHFVGGMVLFMAGHAFTIASFLQRRPFDLATLGILAAALLLAGTVLAHWRKLLPKGQLLPFAIYGVVLSLMGATGAALFLGGTPALTMAALGAVLFTVSDLMVGEETLQKRSKPFAVAVMVLYEGAQLLLASACL